MKGKRFLTLLLALLMLGGTLTACAGNAEKEADTTVADDGDTEAVETEQQWYDKTSLADTDWDGRDYHVLGWNGDGSQDLFGNFDICVEAEIGETVNDAVYKRNALVSEKYNVTISQQLENNPNTVLQECITANDDIYDLAFVPLIEVSSCSLYGYCYDLNDIENVDLTKSYWNQELNEQLEVKGNLIMATSDFALTDKHRVYTLIYNPELAESNNIPSIVDSVKDGSWTSDLMLSYTKVIAKDLDGDGKMGLDDQWAVAMDSRNAFAAFYFGFDNRIVTTDEATGDFVLNMNNDHSITSIDKAVELVCDKTNSFFCEDCNGVDDIWMAAENTFYAGRALFVTTFPHQLPSFAANADFNYTVIPFPKYDESQELYTTLADVRSMLFGIPTTVKDTAFAGFMIEALSAAATDTSLEAYYEIACKTKYSFNEYNGEMLDLIFDGIIYEKATIYDIGGLYYILADNIPSARRNQFASAYARAEKTSLKDIQKLMDALAETYGE